MTEQIDLPRLLSALENAEITNVDQYHGDIVYDLMIALSILADMCDDKDAAEDECDVEQLVDMYLH